MPLGDYTGEVVYNYRLLDEIGVGGFGTVYLAEHIDLGRGPVRFKGVQIGIQIHQAQIDDAHYLVAVRVVEHVAGDTCLVGSPVANIREEPVKERGKFSAGQFWELTEYSYVLGEKLKSPTKLGKSQFLGEMRIVRIFGRQGLQ